MKNVLIAEGNLKKATERQKVDLNVVAVIFAGSNFKDWMKVIQMPKLKDKQLWHICEYGSRKEMKEAINKLCGALYCTGEEEGYRSGFECGYDTRKKEGDSNG